MSILTAVPAPVPTWVQEGYFPSFAKDETALVALNTNRWAWRGYFNEPPSSATPMLVDGPSGSGGGSLARHELALGVPMALRYSTTAITQGDVWRFPFIPAALNPGTAMGHLIGRPDWRVCWMRVPITDVGGTGDAASGHVWSWDTGLVADVKWAQAGDAVQQHGVYGTGAGIEYRSYSSAPALVDTIALPGYVSGEWNTLDHVFISGAPGRAPAYNLYVNGVLIVNRNFGTAELPYVAQARLQMVTRTTAAAGAWYYAYMHWRCGTYAPDGRQYLT